MPGDRRPLGLQLDVADSAAVDAACEQAAERHGRIDVLVTNAGVELPHAPTEAELPDLTMGKMLVIKGTDVSFYIPSTGIEVVTDEPEHRVDLLHRNIRKHGTITNTIDAACELTGEIVARRSNESDMSSLSQAQRRDRELHEAGTSMVRGDSTSQPLQDEPRAKPPT